MTREEAIKRLKSDIYKYSDFAENPNENEFWTAFDMAIKALEVADLDGYSSRLWKAAYERGKADAEQRWIPVSERLPKDEQEILFSKKTGSVHSGRYYDDDSANQWYSHKDLCRARNNVVTAWMPLPEPYKAESEEV